ncbi:NAD(P)H-binding protein [Chthonobacter rhizosphaerae]|uniref:NAD(P)H-binding protein n=1 Tax=Chthonobacter rhizosphaerae TaxID=2735553 RepID=UPI0015EF3872|nr:NAD(P)H-binding protein [Chthonobacter rhizosphaerae]
MTLFVANANGKVGTDLVAALLAGGHAVRVGARDLAKARAAFPGAEVVAFDYADVPAHAAALDGVTALFTAAPPWLLPAAEIDLLALARDKGVRRIVKLSYLGAELAPESPHGRAERAIEASGLEWTHIRPTFFNQNFSTAHAATIRTEGAFYEPAADGASAFIDTRDIAAVVVKALTEPGHNGKAYGLTGSESLTRHQVAEALSAALGRTIRYVPVDDAALRASLAGAPQALVELLSGLYGAVRAGQTAATTTTVADLLGRPPIRFADFATDAAATWR